MNITRRLFTFGVAAAVGLALHFTAGPSAAADKFITVASTTSTEASGLFGFLLPKFQDKTGIEVHVVAVGTGQAIRIAENGDADVLFVHHKPSEEKFVAEGYGVKRYDVMYNDFVIVGPRDDPAGIRGDSDAAAALKRIAEKQAVFVSRGDDSGTHKKELSLWQAAGVDVSGASGTWYRETGQGMGATLTTANAMQGYVLTDRGTWISFKNKADLDILVQGDARLFNQYGVTAVSAKRFPHVKADLAETFVKWIISPGGQQVIADYKLGGQQLFFPNAGQAK